MLTKSPKHPAQVDLPDAPAISEQDLLEMDRHFKVSPLQRRIINHNQDKYNSPDQQTRVGYMSRVFVMATIPHRNPKTIRFTRKNGAFRLTITAATEGIGLPYGSYPRLILAWVCTEAVHRQSRVIPLGNNLSDFMRKIGLSYDSKTIKTLKEQAKRLFSCAIRVVYEKNKKTSVVESLDIANKFDLWKKGKNNPAKMELGTSVELTEKFYKDILAHPIPVDWEKVILLKRSPLALDTYMWLTWRLSYLQKQTIIPWESMQEQFGAGYPNTTRGKLDFKARFKKTLETTSMVYPQARYNTNSKKGLVLFPSQTDVSKVRGG